MASVSVRFNFAAYAARLNQLVASAEDLEPAMMRASRYMVNSTRNRILRSKTAPDGERWQQLSDVTIFLKGHDRPLFQQGGLAAGIKAQRVSEKGFTIAATDEKSPYHQYGVRYVKGIFKGTEIPARPFLGFSPENLRRISRILVDHMNQQAGAVE